MLNFGDIRLHHPNIAKALDTYVRQVLMQDEEWPKDYNKWDPEGTDWGWISSSHTASVPTRMQGLMKKHGFIHSRTDWGETCYYLSAKDQRELPKSLDSIIPTETDECSICKDIFSEEESAAILPCKHLFHENCILLWLYIKGGCALCRQNPLEIVNNLNNLKDQGNKAARGGQFMQAVDLYSQCLSRLDKLTDIPALRIALNTNLALMYIRLKVWDDVEKHAALALKIPGIVDEQIAKASYRRGLAHIGLKNWESAQTALEVAKRYAPSDVAIQKALAELEEKRGTQQVTGENRLPP